MIDAAHGACLPDLLASERLARDEVVPGVVGTLMMNIAVELALKAKSVAFVRAKVGDRYVLEELHRHHWPRATCWCRPC